MEQHIVTPFNKVYQFRDEYTIARESTSNSYRSVPQIRPPFCNLSLSTKRRGGAYTRDATISLAITPPSPFPVPIKHDLIVGGR